MRCVWKGHKVVAYSPGACALCVCRVRVRFLPTASISSLQALFSAKSKGRCDLFEVMEKTNGTVVFYGIDAPYLWLPHCRCAKSLRWGCLSWFLLLAPRSDQKPLRHFLSGTATEILADVWRGDANQIACEFVVIVELYFKKVQWSGVEAKTDSHLFC